MLELAGTVENLGAAAYLGQAANIKSPAVLAAALSIHSVEGRHASALNTLLGESITPDGAFAEAGRRRNRPASPSNPSSSAEPASERERRTAMTQRSTCTARARRCEPIETRRQRGPLAWRRDPQGGAGRRAPSTAPMSVPPFVSRVRWRCPTAATSASSISPSRSSTWSRPSTRKRRRRAGASGELKSLIDLVGKDEERTRRRS